MPPMIDQAKCRVCGLCMQICPLDVFTKKEEKIIVAYPEECWHCRACVIVRCKPFLCGIRCRT